MSVIGEKTVQNVVHHLLLFPKTLQNMRQPKPA